MAQSLYWPRKKSEIRQFFRPLTHCPTFDIQVEKFRPLMNGDRYITTASLPGKLKLDTKDTGDYRLNWKIPYYKIGGTIVPRRKDVLVHYMWRNRWKAARLNRHPRLSTDGFSFSMEESHDDTYTNRSPDFPTMFMLYNAVCAMDNHECAVVHHHQAATILLQDYSYIVFQFCTVLFYLRIYPYIWY